MLQDTPPQAIIDTLRAAGRRARDRDDGELVVSPRATTRIIFPRPGEPLLVPDARDDAARPSASARSSSGCRSSAPTPTSTRRSTGANGTRPAFIPIQLKSLEDFENKVPVVQKKDLREAQTRAPPFGDYLCVPERDVFHIHGTSGTTGRPTAFAIGRNDWRAIANAHARIMWGMGLRPGDTICVAAIFSPLYGKLGRARRRGTARRQGVSVRRRRAGHVGALRAMARHDEADRVLRHADLCAASRAGRAATKASIRATSAQDHVLFRRARRVDSRRARQDRGASTAPRSSIAARWRR